MSAVPTPTEEAVAAVVEVLIAHQRIPLFDGNGSQRCVGCDNLSGETDGPNSPRHAAHVARALLDPAGPVAALLPGLLDALDAERARADRSEAQADDERAGRQVAGESADRFRDVLSECLGHPDENPGDDVLVTEVRAHFGKSGPEPRRWRDFCAGALAHVDQVRAALFPAQTEGEGERG